MTAKKKFTVSEITRQIKGVLETSFTNVSVEGEISNFKRHSSGHLYFTLKDENAQISGVMWRGRASTLFFTPQDGMKVIATGNITLYEIRGQYQLDTVRLQPLGIGELQIAFERLKQKLAEEGLFAAEHKRPIPEYPERIGIVTSPTGAAIQDIVNIITRRFPSVELILYPVKVQGEGAALEIAQAVKDFNKYGRIDVMIVGRGGGSLEDLWAFNEEVVARAIYESKIPVISAVGHEIDFTIADFVADLRAPTPSAAAELVVKQQGEIIEYLRNFCYTTEQEVKTIVSSYKDRIASLVSSYSFNRPLDLLRQNTQRIDELKRALTQTASHKFMFYRQNLCSLEKRMSSVNPQNILKRGYTIVHRNTAIIDHANKLKRNENIVLQFQDGNVPAKIQ